MASRDIVTSAGKGAELSASNHDQNINGLAGTAEEQSGATYTVVYTDQGKTIELNNASMVCTLTLVSTIAGQIDTDNFTVTLKNTNAANASIACSGADTIDGRASIGLAQYEVIVLQTNVAGDGWNRIAPTETVSGMTGINVNGGTFTFTHSTTGIINVVTSSGASALFLTASGTNNNYLYAGDSGGEKSRITFDTDGTMYFSVDAGSSTLMTLTDATTQVDITGNLAVSAAFSASTVAATTITGALTGNVTGNLTGTASAVADDSITFESSIYDATQATDSGTLIAGGTLTLGYGVFNLECTSGTMNVQVKSTAGSWRTIATMSSGDGYQVIGNNADVRLYTASGVGYGWLRMYW